MNSPSKLLNRLQNLLYPKGREECWALTSCVVTRLFLISQDGALEGEMGDFPLFVGMETIYEAEVDLGAIFEELEL